MLTALFPAKQAKAMPLDGWYRIPKPAASTQSTSRDNIIRFQQSQDRLAFMAAIRNRSPLQFEEHSLTYFPDLSRATLDWRRSLRPLTKELIARKIPYRWGAPRSLIIPQEHGDLKLTNAAEIPCIVQTLGLPEQKIAVSSQPSPSTTTHWDPEKVRPLVPAALRGNPSSPSGS
ncbi:Hypothetical predicted protein [Pelobates cultripes]|uniref:Uncharacterized protein n=1 Tax=Pelobates cultripes TaxID=61616 RepID=A0AAD1W1R4_PELCU|nr:Hypothetical predicted protein [Pelobates cultripes]